MCQEQHTHPPMPVWLTTPRPHAPDVRPWRPPLQIIMTLSEASPTGRDRSPACVQTALVHHIDPLTVCKTTEPLFQSAFSARTSSWRAVQQHPRHKHEQLPNYESILSPHAPRNQERSHSMPPCTLLGRHPKENVGLTSSQMLCVQKTVLVFTASKLAILAAMFRMRAGFTNGGNSGISSSIRSTINSDAPSLSSQS